MSEVQPNPEIQQDILLEIEGTDGSPFCLLKISYKSTYIAGLGDNDISQLNRQFAPTGLKLKISSRQQQIHRDAVPMVKYINALENRPEYLRGIMAEFNEPIAERFKKAAAKIEQYLANPEENYSELQELLSTGDVFYGLELETAGVLGHVPMEQIPDSLRRMYPRNRAALASENIALVVDIREYVRDISNGVIEFEDITDEQVIFSLLLNMRKAPNGHIALSGGVEEGQITMEQWETVEKYVARVSQEIKQRHEKARKERNTRNECVISLLEHIAEHNPEVEIKVAFEHEIPVQHYGRTSGCPMHHKVFRALAKYFSVVHKAKKIFAKLSQE